MNKWLRRLLWLLMLFGSGAGGWRVARNVNGGVLTVPTEVVARPGRIALIRADAPARVVWHACSAAQPPDLLPLEDGRAVVFVAGPGRYELLAWSAADGQPTEAVKCVVRVEPESPPDALTAKLRAAWAKETSSERDRYRELLAGLYQAAADDTVKQANIRTPGELLATLRQAAKTLMPDDALPALRAAVAEELRSTLPSDPETTFDDALRRKCGDAFRRIAEALDHI